MARRPLAGYPQPIGASVQSIFPHAGPTDYTVVTTGPLAGGDTVIAAPESGMKWFDTVIGGVSDSGLYRVEAMPPVANPSTPMQGASAKTFVLRWFVVATGVEVAAHVDLSAQIVRLNAFGHN